VTQDRDNWGAKNVNTWLRIGPTGGASGSMNRGKSLDWLSNYWILRKTLFHGISYATTRNENTVTGLTVVEDFKIL